MQDDTISSDTATPSDTAGRRDMAGSGTARDATTARGLPERSGSGTGLAGQADGMRGAGAGSEDLGSDVVAPGIAVPGMAVPGMAVPGVVAPGVAGPGTDGPGTDGPGIDGPGIDRLATEGSRTEGSGISPSGDGASDDSPSRAVPSGTVSGEVGRAGADTQRVVLVTGPSGAGRSTAINVLEDLGFEAIDNLPLSLIPRLLDGPARPAPLALGLDVRNRDFSAANVIELIDRLTRAPGYAPEVLYLDCHADVLVRRYGETRRRHPLSPDEAPMAGVLAEISLLAAIRGRADVLIDTTELSPHDLKAELTHWFALRPDRRLGVSLHSFSYKRGVPRGLDLMFDCRFLANPHWEPALRPLDGRDARVQAHVGDDPRFAEFFDRTRDLVLFLLPAHMDEGKSHLAVGFGCTGGQHRSVTLVEKMAVALAEASWPVSIRHRELERRAAAMPSGSDVPQSDRPVTQPRQAS